MLLLQVCKYLLSLNLSYGVFPSMKVFKCHIYHLSLMLYLL